MKTSTPHFSGFKMRIFVTTIKIWNRVYESSNIAKLSLDGINMVELLCRSIERQNNVRQLINFQKLGNIHVFMKYFVIKFYLEPKNIPFILRMQCIFLENQLTLWQCHILFVGVLWFTLIEQYNFLTDDVKLLDLQENSVRFWNEMKDYVISYFHTSLNNISSIIIYVLSVEAKNWISTCLISFSSLNYLPCKKFIQLLIVPLRI